MALKIPYYFVEIHLNYPALKRMQTPVSLLKYCPTLGLHISLDNLLFISVEEEEMSLCFSKGFASNVSIPAAVCSYC